MDGSRVVKIFELDAAQGFVGLDWTGSAMALTRGGDDKKKKTEKKEPHQLMASDQRRRREQKPAAAAAAVATGAGTVRQ